MNVAIMQPYFFPYLGYFCLLKHTDRFIVFDTAQYIKQGWISRNRILHPVAGWQYIIVPTQKYGQKTPINEVRINTQKDWRTTLLSQLGHYRHIAPYYKDVCLFLQMILSNEQAFVSELNTFCLRETCKYLGLPVRIEVFSQLRLDVEPARSPDEWALNICKALGGVDEYINPPGGAKFYDRSKYEQAHLGLKFEQFVAVPYDQKRPSFEPHLSIIDVMMFNSPHTILAMLDHCQCV